MRERVILSILVKGKPSLVHMTPRPYLELDAWWVQHLKAEFMGLFGYIGEDPHISYHFYKPTPGVRPPLLELQPGPILECL